MSSVAVSTNVFSCSEERPTLILVPISLHSKWKVNETLLIFCLLFALKVPYNQRENRTIWRTWNIKFNKAYCLAVLISYKLVVHKSCLSTFFIIPLIFTQPKVSITYPPILWIMCKPSHHSVEDVLFIAYVQFFHGEKLTQSIGGKLPEFLRQCHITKMCLQELSGCIVDMVKAVMQREDPDPNAIFCSDTALQELATQWLEVSHEEQVRCLHHVLDGLFIQSDLYV